MQQPAARLLVAVAAVIVLIVVLALVVRDCRRNQLVDSYSGYIRDGVTPIAAKSKDEGERLLALLANTKRDTPENVQKNVRAIGREADGLVTQAQELNAPDRLGDAHRSLVLALQYRANGIKSLAEVIPNAAKSRDRNDAAAKLAAPMGRILASDFLYSDSFVFPARKALEDDNVDGVEVPESALLAGSTHANKAGPAGARAVWTALQASGGTTTNPDSPTGGRRGTGIVSVKLLPENKQLVIGSVNTVKSSVDNQWEVTIENGGESVETGIEVTATLSPAGGAPQVTKGTITTVDPGEQASVKIPVGTAPAFGENADLTIDVKTVPGETLAGNNTNKFTVQFAF
jgi:hypothetical protein